MEATNGFLVGWGSVPCGQPIELTRRHTRDRKLLTEHTRRVSKALRALKGRGLAHGAKDRAGEYGLGRSLNEPMQ
jgi:hypothetical protein